MDKSRYNTYIQNIISSINRDSRFEKIRDRGFSVERIIPFSGKHYDKYSFALKNGQEISFRIYSRDSFDDTKDLIISVINSFDNILSICSSKIRFEKRKLLHRPYISKAIPFGGGGGVLSDFVYSMDYFDETESIDLNKTFLSQQKDDELMYKLVSSRKIRKHYSHIYFRRLENGSSEMLYNWGFSPNMLSVWDDCLNHACLHYALQDCNKYLDTASGFFVIPLKSITSEENLHMIIETINQFVLINSYINKKYPGSETYFYPYFTFKVYPRKLKTNDSSFITPVIDVEVGDKVHHKSFGNGVVKQIVNDKRRVVVEFENYGEKTLVNSIDFLEKRF